MEYIKGYQYTSETDAQEWQKVCDQFYGIPKSPEDSTTHWCTYSLAEFNEPQFWYITYDESLLPILGEPIEFELIYPN